MAYGEDAEGKGIECPRDHEKDCSIVDAFHHECPGRAGALANLYPIDPSLISHSCVNR